MLQQYPVILIPDENGSIIAQFPDVPEAMTVGSDEANALAWAQDALVIALSGYIDDRRDIPKPSPIKEGQRAMPLPPMVAMKLAVYQAMRDEGVTQAELGARMGVDGRQIRRILDLDHNTILPHLEQALKALGKRLVIDILEAA